MPNHCNSSAKGAAQRSLSTLYAYDTESLEPRGSALAIEDADNVRFDARLRRILVGGSSKTQGAVVSFDPRTLVKVGEVPLPSHAESFRCDPSSPRLFVNLPGDKFSDSDGIVVLADRDKNSVVQRWRLPGIARNFPMALDPTHRRVFVVGRKPARLLALDSGSGAVLGTTPCVADSDDMFFDVTAGVVFIIGGGRRVLLETGRVAAIGTPAEVITEETIRRVYGVQVAVQPNGVSRRPHVVLTAGMAGKEAESSEVPSRP